MNRGAEGPAGREAASIRRATPADAGVLAQLRWEFRSAVAPPLEEEAAFVARCRAWMAERLEDASPWLCWVAEADGRVLGCLWMQSIEKVPNPVDEPERHAYVTSVYVRPDRRGCGTGTALVASALAWCRAHATDAVVLWPTDESRSLYARAGFRAPGCAMELDLRGSTPADR